MNDETTDPVFVELKRLMDAATRFFDEAQRRYREEHPEDHRAYCILVEKGGAEPFVAITLSAAPRVAAGFRYQGAEHPIITWPGAPGAATLN